jgi:integrase/recombinase XerC
MSDTDQIRRTPALAARHDALEAFAAAMRRRGLRPSTIDKRIFLLRRWWLYTDGRWWTATRRQVEAFIDSSDLTAASSRYATVSHLHRFYVWARREGLTRRDPTELVERPRLTPRLPRPITDTDLAVALSLADGPVLAALMLAAGSGLRACELATLRWDDIDRDALRITGKGGRDRIVPLHAAAREALDRLDRTDEWVLPWRAYNERVVGCRVSHIINRYLRSVGSSATLHQLRHWCATKALAGTKDLRAVQELLGHANPATTALYTKCDPEHIRHAVDAVPLPSLAEDFAAKVLRSDSLEAAENLDEVAAIFVRPGSLEAAEIVDSMPKNFGHPTSAD